MMTLNRATWLSSLLVAGLAGLTLMCTDGAAAGANKGSPIPREPVLLVDWTGIKPAGIDGIGAFIPEQEFHSLIVVYSDGLISHLRVLDSSLTPADVQSRRGIASKDAVDQLRNDLADLGAFKQKDMPSPLTAVPLQTATITVFKGNQGKTGRGKSQSFSYFTFSGSVDSTAPPGPLGDVIGAFVDLWAP